MLNNYRAHAAEREALGIPPLPLDAKQTAELIELIKNPPAGEDTAFLLDLLTYRVPPGVDDAAKVKASFLAAVAHGDLKVGLISKAKATAYLPAWIWSNRPPSAKCSACAFSQEPNAWRRVTSCTGGNRAMSAGSAYCGLRGR